MKNMFTILTEFESLKTERQRIMRLKKLSLVFELWTLEWRALFNKEELTYIEKEKYVVYYVGSSTFYYPIIGDMLPITPTFTKYGIDKNDYKVALERVSNYFKSFNKPDMREEIEYVMKYFFNVCTIAFNMMETDKSVKIMKEILGDDYDPEGDYTDEMKKLYVYPAYRKSDKYFYDYKKYSLNKLKNAVQAMRYDSFSFASLTDIGNL